MAGKASPGLGGAACAHTQCLRHEGTQPHRLPTGLAPSWVPGGRRDCCPISQLLQPATEALKGDGIWPDLWRARGEGGVSPAPAQLLRYRTVGDEVRWMDRCCGGMWGARQVPAGAKDGEGCNRVVDGSYLVSLSHGHPIPGTEHLWRCSRGHRVTCGEDTRFCGAAGVC